MTLEGQHVRLLEVARRYLERGWHPIELPAGKKGPPPEGRTGRAGRDMTLGEVEAARWVGNIALRMPVDVIGIDVDRYRGGGPTLDDLVARLGPLPPTSIVHSDRGDGSGTVLYRVPTGMAWVTSLAGVDIIQRWHRYLCVPPSVHPDGRIYGAWDQEERAKAELRAVEDLPDLPWPWQAHLQRAVEGEARSSAVSGEEVEAFVGVCSESDAPSYLSVLLDRFTERTRQGFSRHDTAQHVLTWAMESSRAGLFTARDALEALGGLWVEAVADDHRRALLQSPTRVTEWQAMVRHAVGRAESKSPEEMGKLRDDVVGPRFNVPPGPPPAAAGPEPGPTTSPPPSAFAPMPRAEDIPDPFVLEDPVFHVAGLLAAPTHGELAGPEKSLKSYLALALAVGLASGRPVLDRFDVPERQRVLFLVGEGGRGPWLRRLAAVCASYGLRPVDLAGWVRFSHATASVSSPRFVDWLGVELEALDPALVILDPWYAYAGGQADSRQVTEVGAQLATLSGLCRSHGASLLILHHFNRQEGTGLRQITGAGHAEWVDSWLLTKHRSPPNVGLGQYRLRLDVGSRQWGGESWDVDWDIDPLTGSVSWSTREAAPEVEQDDGDEAFALLRASVLRVGRRARRPLDRAAWTQRVKGRVTAVRAAFDELVGDGLIVETGVEQRRNMAVPMYRVDDL
jgi:hypothetical protein